MGYPIKARQIKSMFKQLGFAKGRQQLRSMLGLVRDERTGKNYIDHQARQIGPEEVSIEDLADTFLDQDTKKEWCTGLASHKAALMETVLGQGYQSRALLEDYAPQTAQAFQDINAWNATVSGLVEVRILEGYRQPRFIAEQFMETQPTRVNGGKMIGIPYPSPSGDVVTPGIEFPSIGMNQYWVWKRPNIIFGEKLSVTRDAVVYDISGELLSKAQELGGGLGYAKEYYAAAHILGLAGVVPQSGYPRPSLVGQIANSFRMNETIDSSANPTFQAAGVTTNKNLKNAYNYVNQLTGGGIVDWTSLNAIRNKFNLMRDPIYQLPIDVEMKKAWVDPFQYDTVLRVRRATQVLNITGNPAGSYGPLSQGAGSTMPPVATGAPGFPSGSQLDSWEPVTSNIWHQVLLDAGISEANAEKYSLWGDPEKAFVWASLWDTDVKTASPTSADLMAQNIVNLWVGQWAGQFVVREPRFVVQQTN